MRLSRSLILVALLGVVSGCAEEAGGLATGAASGTSSARRPALSAAADRLPSTVAGFTRRDTTVHEAERAGMGIAVDYDGPARSAVSTVSLYDRGRASVPDDINASILQEEFTAAVNEALAMAGTRTSHRIVERGRADVDVPGQSPMRCANLQGTYGRQEVNTLVCVGAAAGRFLKVLVTAPARQVRPVDPVPFVIGIAQAARG